MQGYNIVILKLSVTDYNYKYRILLTIVLTGSGGYYGCIYPPSRCGISGSTIKGPPTSNNSTHDADYKTSKPDFAAMKELVEQHVDSYRYSRASLVQELAIRRPLLELQALLVSKLRPWTDPWLSHLVGEQLLCFCCCFEVLVPSSMAPFSCYFPKN